MKSPKLQQIIFVWIFVLLAFLSIEAQQTKEFSEAKGSGKIQARYNFDKWIFSVGKNRYEIRKDGKAKKTNIRSFQYI